MKNIITLILVFHFRHLSFHNSVGKPKTGLFLVLSTFGINFPSFLQKNAESLQKKMERDTLLLISRFKHIQKHFTQFQNLCLTNSSKKGFFSTRWKKEKNVANFKAFWWNFSIKHKPRNWEECIQINSKKQQEMGVHFSSKKHGVPLGWIHFYKLMM